MSECTIDLCFYGGAGIILLCPSGVQWTSQVGGMYCHHPVAEGVYLPLVGMRDGIADTLEQSEFLRDRYAGSFSAQDIPALNTLLDELFVGHLEIDSERLSLSEEAWLYVRIHPCTTGPDFLQILEGLTGHVGILTWSNSD